MVQADAVLVEPPVTVAVATGVAVPAVLAPVAGGAELAAAEALLGAADDCVRVAGAARLRGDCVDGCGRIRRCCRRSGSNKRKCRRRTNNELPHGSESSRVPIGAVLLT